MGRANTITSEIQRVLQRPDWALASGASAASSILLRYTPSAHDRRVGYILIQKSSIRLVSAYPDAPEQHAWNFDAIEPAVAWLEMQLR